MSVDLVVHAGTKLALEQWLAARGLTDATFHWWNHPSGRIGTLSGVYARLSFPSLHDMPASLTDWVANDTATSVLESFAGVGGEGVTIVNPEDVYAYCAANDIPPWGGLLGVSNQWSDPRLWAFRNVMTGDRRDFGGTTYESLIDFNLWSPSQYPAGWQEVGPATGAWTAGTSYAVDDEVTHQGATYRCIQAHDAIAGWEPPNVPALWEAI